MQLSAGDGFTTLNNEGALIDIYIANDDSNKPILYIPIIRPLNSCLTADEIEEITGIVNGTTNYMLTKMSEEGLEFDDVLKDAQAKGYAEKWLDVRAFGQVFAFKDAKGLSVGVRGPVSIHQASSVSAVEIESIQITKSVNGEKKEKGESRASDTMGMKHFVRFGLYEIKGSINVQLAEKTGFTQEDAQTVKECLRTLFANDASSARPEGSMEVVKLFWWEHNCKDGQYSSAKVHRSVKVALKNENSIPRTVDDYAISLDTLPGLEPEIIDGI